MAEPELPHEDDRDLEVTGPPLEALPGEAVGEDEHSRPQPAFDPLDSSESDDLYRMMQQTIEKLERLLGKSIRDKIRYERTWDPPGIAADTGSHLGALYGTSSNSRLAALLRHRNQSKQYDNLYFVGGSVHPGGGVPLALLSAKIATQLVSER